MSERKEDGGPAFPTVPNTKTYHHGMALRDWFAGRAMAAMIVGNQAAASVCGKDGAVGLSKDAYIVADAMLAERSK